MLTNEYVYVKTLQSVYIVMKVVRTVQGRNKLLKHRWCIAIQMCCIKDLLYLSLWHWISLLENVLYGAAVTSETRCHCLSTIPVSSYFIFIFWEICICTCICLSIYLDCRILLNIASLKRLVTELEKKMSIFLRASITKQLRGLFHECAALNGNISPKKIKK